MEIFVAGITVVAMAAAGILASCVLTLDNTVRELRRKIEKIRRIMLVNQLAEREHFTNEYLEADDDKW